MGDEVEMDMRDLDGDAGQEADSEVPANVSLDEIQKCLEELLSRQNLSEDAFIQQHMNTQMYIPLCILAGHTTISDKCKGVDVESLLKAARQSDKLGVDEENMLVKPKLIPRRNTLILHDLPEDIAEEELQELFGSSPEPLSAVKLDVNRTAFASFQTDEAATTAALWLRSQKLRDVGVKCAVKSEHIIRSFCSPPGGPSTRPVAAGGMAQYPVMQQQQAMMMYPPWAAAAWGYDVGAGAAGPEMWAGDGSGDVWGLAAETGGEVSGKVGPKGKGKGKGKRGRKGSFSAPGDEYVARMEPSLEASPLMQPHGTPQQQMLPEPSMTGDGSVAGMDGGMGDIGYTHEYRRYSRVQILEICSGMDEVAKPEGYARLEGEAPEQAAALFRQSPCKDWAPLPTPQTSFASSFLEGGGRRSTSEDIDASGGNRKGSSRRRSSRSMDRGADGDEWADQSGSTGDWNTGQAAGTRSERRWTGDYWGSDWYGPQWVEKAKKDETKEEDAEEKEGSEKKRTMSWAEKVKSAGSSTQPQRWQPKTKTREQEPEAAASSEVAVEPSAALASASEDQCSEPAPAATANSTDVPPPAASAGAAPTQELPAAASPKPAAPTWADKVRLGSPKAKTSSGGPSAGSGT